MRKYNALRWLVGSAQIDRNFVNEVSTNGLDGAIDDCPCDDLTDDEVKAFLAAVNSPLMRFTNWLNWCAYRLLRFLGRIPSASRAPWDP